MPSFPISSSLATYPRLSTLCKMAFCVSMLAIAAVCCAAAPPPEWKAMQTEDAWQRFLTVYKRSYATGGEYEQRKQIFTHNLDRIKADSSSSYSIDINHLADLSLEEVKRRSMTAQGQQHAAPNASQVMLFSHPAALNNASSVDWRTSGCIAAVRNQVMPHRCCLMTWSSSSLHRFLPPYTPLIFPPTGCVWLCCARCDAGPCVGHGMHPAQRTPPNLL